jgi:aspartyl protease family protein
MSTVLKHAAGTAAGWLFAGACIVGSLVYFDELRSLTSTALGLKAEQATLKAEYERLQAKRQERVASTSARSNGRIVELNAGGNGHFFTSVEVNGRPVDVLVDTGATMVAFTNEDAERAGIFVRQSDYTHRVNTANGVARIAPVTVDRISIGEITVRNVQAAVSEPGKLQTTLLGMSFLGRLSRAEMRQGKLILEE